VDRTMTDLRNVRKLPKNAQARIARELKKINLSFKPSGDDDRDLHAAISILEAALRSVNTERLRINLSEHYTSLGIIAGNDKRRDECQQHLKAALELHPDNVKAKENLAIVMKNDAIDLFNDDDDYAGAVRLLRQVVDLDPGNPQHKEDLSLVLSNWGVVKCNDASDTYSSGYQEGIRLLREALDLDPTNEHAINNLIAVGEVPSSMNLRF